METIEVNLSVDVLEKNVLERLSLIDLLTYSDKVRSKWEYLNNKSDEVQSYWAKIESVARDKMFIG